MKLLILSFAFLLMAGQSVEAQVPLSCQDARAQYTPNCRAQRNLAWVRLLVSGGASNNVSGGTECRLLSNLGARFDDHPQNPVGSSCLAQVVAAERACGDADYGAACSYAAGSGYGSNPVPMIGLTGNLDYWFTDTNSAGGLRLLDQNNTSLTQASCNGGGNVWIQDITQSGVRRVTGYCSIPLNTNAFRHLRCVLQNDSPRHCVPARSAVLAAFQTNRIECQRAMSSSVAPAADVAVFCGALALK